MSRQQTETNSLQKKIRIKEICCIIPVPDYRLFINLIPRYSSDKGVKLTNPDMRKGVSFTKATNHPSNRAKYLENRS